MSNPPRLLILLPAVAFVAGAEASTTPPSPPVPPDLGPGLAASDQIRVFPFNDLGMHCMDAEFSIFTLLPPFNVLNAQVVYRNPNGMPMVLDDTYFDLYYNQSSDIFGSVNSHSIGKTDFWDYASSLFGEPIPEGQGLTGLYLPGDAPQPGPQPMAWEADHGWFSAFGLPMTPLDDAGLTNPYPVLRVAATYRPRERVMASTPVVVPVSQETNCFNCHATGGMAADRPGLPWSDDPDLEVQTKLNVLILHDADNGTDLQHSTPVLCAQCHYSAALDLEGTGPTGDQIGKPTASRAIHYFHGTREDDQGNLIFPPGGPTEQTCYQCHPGPQTQCERGPMRSGGMECAECHFSMQSVGGAEPLLPGGSIDGQNDGQPRRPWVDMPRCQSCHTGDAISHLSGPDYVAAPGGIRLAQAYRVGDPSASPILADNKRFAENPNTLYRFSKGHGGMACEACHGSTHAEWPNGTEYSNDNWTAYSLQGHTGKVIECGTCHADGTLGLTTNGPHALHNVNDQRWVNEHKDFYRSNPQNCRACHGIGLQGTVLSKTAVERTFRIEDDLHEGNRWITIPKGTQVACNTCHEMPDL